MRTFLRAFQVDCEGDADRDEHHHVHNQLDDPESDALFGQALSRGRSAHITKYLGCTQNCKWLLIRVAGILRGIK